MGKIQKLRQNLCKLVISNKCLEIEFIANKETEREKGDKEKREMAQWLKKKSLVEETGSDYSAALQAISHDGINVLNGAILTSKYHCQIHCDTVACAIIVNKWQLIAFFLWEMCCWWKMDCEQIDLKKKQRVSVSVQSRTVNNHYFH